MYFLKDVFKIDNTILDPSNKSFKSNPRNLIILFIHFFLKTFYFVWLYPTYKPIFFFFLDWEQYFANIKSKLQLVLSGWHVYGPENGYNFPYTHLLEVNNTSIGSVTFHMAGIICPQLLCGTLRCKN